MGYGAHGEDLGVVGLALGVSAFLLVDRLVRDLLQGLGFRNEG